MRPVLRIVFLVRREHIRFQKVRIVVFRVLTVLEVMLLSWNNAVTVLLENTKMRLELRFA
jgi:hypothetical protein